MAQLPGVASRLCSALEDHSIEQRASAAAIDETGGPREHAYQLIVAGLPEQELRAGALPALSARRGEEGAHGVWRDTGTLLHAGRGTRAVHLARWIGDDTAALVPWEEVGIAVVRVALSV
jgi:hypothetical protein